MVKTRSYQRTSEHYRKRGYRVVKAEYHARGRSHDLMGFVDGIAFGIGHTIYFQACAKDWQPHVRKMTGPCRQDLRRVLMAGNRVVLMGWRKLKRGNRSVWTPRIHEFKLAELDA